MENIIYNYTEMRRVLLVHRFKEQILNSIPRHCVFIRSHYKIASQVGAVNF